MSEIRAKEIRENDHFGSGIHHGVFTPQVREPHWRNCELHSIMKRIPCLSGVKKTVKFVEFLLPSDYVQQSIQCQAA